MGCLEQAVEYANHIRAGLIPPAGADQAGYWNNRSQRGRGGPAGVLRREESITMTIEEYKEWLRQAIAEQEATANAFRFDIGSNARCCEVATGKANALRVALNKAEELSQ